MNENVRFEPGDIVYVKPRNGHSYKGVAEIYGVSWFGVFDLRTRAKYQAKLGHIYPKNSLISVETNRMIRIKKGKL